MLQTLIDDRLSVFLVGLLAGQATIFASVTVAWFA
jgi:hypothetical protein